MTLALAIPPIVVGLPFGWDAVVYTEAARQWLAGGDPWAPGPITYAAPPTSFLPYLPFVWLPDPLVSWAWLGICTASALYTFRKVGLPLWWLLFPPISLGIMAGSSALPVVALLVRGGVLADGAAVLMRAYAAVPLLVLGRWRSLIVAAGMLALTLPMWPAWWEARDVWRAAITAQAGMSTPLWVLPLAVLGLGLLGRQRGGWLIVPALWPDSQLYYGVLALPVLATMPIVALSMTLPVPGLLAVGMVVQGVILAGRGRTMGDTPRSGSPASWWTARRTTPRPLPSSPVPEGRTGSVPRG